MESFKNEKYWFGFKRERNPLIHICPHNFVLIHIQNKLVGEFISSLWFHTLVYPNQLLNFYIYYSDKYEKYENIKTCNFYEFEYYLSENVSNIYIKSKCGKCTLKIKAINYKGDITLCNPIFELDV
jgi:hypothetical protein